MRVKIELKDSKKRRSLAMAFIVVLNYALIFCRGNIVVIAVGMSYVGLYGLYFMYKEKKEFEKFYKEESTNEYNNGFNTRG